MPQFASRMRRIAALTFCPRAVLVRTTINLAVTMHAGMKNGPKLVLHMRMTLASSPPASSHKAQLSAGCINRQRKRATRLTRMPVNN